MNSSYSIKLNANNSNPVRTGYTFKSGDKGITFRITVEGLDYSGTTAKIVFKRANHTSVEHAISASNGVYIHTIQGNELEIPGPVVADVKFYASNNRVSTTSFIFGVTSDTLDGLGQGTAGYSDELERLTAELSGVLTQMQQASAQLSAQTALFNQTLNNYINQFSAVGCLNPRGQYNASTAYSVLDLVFYNGVSWICRQACTGKTPSNGTYWQPALDITGLGLTVSDGKLCVIYKTT